MTKPPPNAGQKWNQFEKTGCPADYLAYRAAKTGRKREKDSGAPPDSFLS